jgi:crossover junction endodeoxyribonuclease RuvC
MRFVGIDPSSKTGFVALDEAGEVLRRKELTGVGSVDPKRIVTLIDEIITHLQPDDVICLEGYSFGSKGKGVSFQYELGGMIREWLFRRNHNYTIITPSQLKKFATGKGNTPKDAMAVPIFKRWGFESNSNNVVDAYVLAQMARAITQSDCGQMDLDLPAFQLEVLKAIAG